MDRIRIKGGQPLHGTIPISGAKNAALPLMIAGLLTEEPLVLENVPRLADVTLLQRILGNHGVDIMLAGKRSGDSEYGGQTLNISAARIVDTTAPYELVSRMRASFWVIGPLLARMGRPAFRCRADARSGRGRSISCSTRCKRSAPKSRSPKDMSSRAPKTGCAAERSFSQSDRGRDAYRSHGGRSRARDDGH